MGWSKDYKKAVVLSLTLLASSPEDAAEPARRLLKKYPRRTRARCMYADLLFASGHTARARAEFRKIVVDDELAAEAWFGLARTSFALHRADRGRRELLQGASALIDALTELRAAGDEVPVIRNSIKFRDRLYSRVVENRDLCAVQRMLTPATAEKPRRASAQRRRR